MFYDYIPMKVISFGGSILYDDKSNFKYAYLKRLKEIFDKTDEKFIFVVGGGKLARELIKRASIIDSEEQFLDKIGILSTKINSLMFEKIFNATFLDFNSFKDDFEIIHDIDNNVVISGIEPGVTTDYDSVCVAKILKLDKVYNFTDVDYWYYDFDTKEPIDCISYDELEEEFELTYEPGMNIPFDPKALKLARKHNIDVFITNGNKFKTVSNLVLENKFKGTKILSN